MNNTLSFLSAEKLAYSLSKGMRLSGNQYKACCPAHDDNNPSLSITHTSDRVLVHCWAGCSQSEVIETLISLGLWPGKTYRGQCSGPPPLTQGDIDYMTSFVVLYRHAIGGHVNPKTNDTRLYYACESRLKLGGINI
jgi:hypothetical protein